MTNRPPKEAREGFYRALGFRPDADPDWDSFPFNIPAIRDLGKVRLHPAVTFLVGENGSGKSTILEAVAVRLGHSETGGSNDRSFNQRPLDGGLHDAMFIDRSWNRRPAETFFMRAETVFDFTNQIERELRENPGFGRDFGRLGGVSLHNRSHGEAFLAIVQNRFTDESLFIMDEPEAALSPLRQLTLLKEIDLLVRRGCQTAWG
jgi:predicted ATPase